MISTLLKRGMTIGLRLMVPFLLIMMMYGGVIVWMYDPALSDMLDQYQQLMPGLMAAVGMDGDTGTLIAFLHTYLYGFLFALIPFIYGTMLLHRQWIQPLEDGSFVCVLASPHSRKSAALTVLFTTFLQLTLFIVLCAGFNQGISAWMFPGELENLSYWKLNFSCLTLQTALCSLVYFAGCVLQNQRHALMAGAGATVLMYLLHSMAEMGDSLRPCRYLTFFSLFPQDTAALQEGILGSSLVLLGITLLLAVMGTAIFSRRDLLL